MMPARILLRKVVPVTGVVQGLEVLPRIGWILSTACGVNESIEICLRFAQVGYPGLALALLKDFTSTIFTSLR
ncbi:MAG TPA: hypothetical protein V6C97_19685 [Oculatellaceae cyanobacterium]